MGKIGGRSARLKRLCADRSKEHSVEAEGRTGCPRHGQVAQMRRVETTAKKGDTAAFESGFAMFVRWGQVHKSMVACGGASASITVTMRYVIALLALAGVAVSALALRVHYSTDTAPCSINEKWDCGIVNHSPFAEIEHVPVAAIGIAGYLVLAGLALARRRTPLAALALVALLFSLYLTHIEKAVLQVYCLYCVISLGIIALMTMLSLGWIFAAPRRA